MRPVPFTLGLHHLPYLEPSRVSRWGWGGDVGASFRPVAHPAFLGGARPSLSPPLLYRKGNRGCRFTKPAFPAPPWRPSLPVHALLLAGAVGLPGPKGDSGRGQAWYPSRTAEAQAGVGFGLGERKPGPPSRAISPAAVTSPASVTQSRKEPAPQLPPPKPRGPRVGHAAAVLEGGGPGRRSRPREDGGFRGRPPEEGRKGASDAHHVCGIEYD